MSVLLIGEVNGGALSIDSTAKALTAAKQIGDVTILCVGAGSSEAAQEAAKLESVSKVMYTENSAYDHDLAEPISDLIVSLSDSYSHIVAPSTSASKSILPRVAALLDVMIISEVTAVVDAETFERPIYAGNAIQTVKSSDRIKIATIRTSTFETSNQGGSAEVEEIQGSTDPGLSKWMEDKVAASDRPELTSAGIVVSGGRGIGSEEDFKIIEELNWSFGFCL